MEPKKKTIHGRFNVKEIEMALVEFKTINSSPVASGVNSVPNKISTQVFPQFNLLSLVFNFFSTPENLKKVFTNLF